MISKDLNHFEIKFTMFKTISFNKILQNDFNTKYINGNVN